MNMPIKRDRFETLLNLEHVLVTHTMAVEALNPELLVLIGDPRPPMLLRMWASIATDMHGPERVVDVALHPDLIPALIAELIGGCERAGFGAAIVAAIDQQLSESRAWQRANPRTEQP